MDLTDAYENGAHIPGAADYPPRWASAASAFRSALGARAECDIDYGSGARQVLDVFRPEGACKGLVVFIHGGYWRKFDKSFWSHLAAGPLARGWAVAVPSYTLAPEARISEITREIVFAVTRAADLVEGPLVITGHSAGGHLSARMACEGVLPEGVAARLRRVVPISPLSDLAPLMQTEMNVDLKIDAAEAKAESPAFLGRRLGVDCTVWVGAEERPAFLDQARWLAEAWGCAHRIAPGRHHFDVIEEMEEVESPLIEALIGGVT
ncbi:putative esterase [Candidatus Rhodobacter oscarellae]|uniref:Putative esterase n=1 Tax=Candidatus Rhodobacter oscarellae TaxID=1675527 RepID=A0A0J9ECG5_9RHOB|nr:alpha/beta hydrolase [Candidatus Rhodobacter lobularis]KMW60341.1 putative esterase [Candidatus Rhodobacter lobularis]